MEIAKCLNGNKAIRICVSDDCHNSNPFICDVCVSNQCANSHKDCILITDWDNFKNKLEKLKQSNNADFLNISKAVQQTINKLMKYLQKQLQYFKTWKSTFGMPTQAVYLLQCIRENQQNKFTGKKVAKILQDIKTEKLIQKYNQDNIKNQMQEVFIYLEYIVMIIRDMYSIKQHKKSEIKSDITLSKELQMLRQMKKSQRFSSLAQMAQQSNILYIPQSLTILQKLIDLRKERYLQNLNTKIMNLKQKPIRLELKCNKSHQNQLQIQAYDRVY